MKESHLIKTNSFNYYSPRLLMGSLFLTLPTCSVILLAILWENFDFLWVPLLFGIAGWVLILPLTYTIPRLSKERIAIDALSMGFVGMLLLCVILIPLKRASLMQLSDPQTLKISDAISAHLNFKEKEKEYLEQLCLHMEEIKRKDKK
jgi:hypothetical protein